MLKVFILVLAIAQTIHAKAQLSNCLSDNKFCFGYPKGCIGPQCYITYSSISNGTHTEMEFLGQDMLPNSFIAMAYSDDQKMGNDFVIFCVKDIRREHPEQKVGLAFNDHHINTIEGTIDELKLKDQYKLELELIDYSTEDKSLYCKLTHRVDRIIDHFNTTNVEIIFTKGVWMKDSLSYHGKMRHNVGQLDLSGEKKKKKKSSAASIVGIASSILSVVIYKVLNF